MLRDGIIASGANVVNRALGLLLVPFLLHAFGAELYVLWTSAFALAGICGVFELGLGVILIRESALLESDPIGEHAAFVRSCSAVYAYSGIAIALVMWSAGAVWARQSAQNPREIVGIFAMLGVALCFEQGITFCHHVLLGMRRVGEANALFTGMQTGRVLLLVALLALHAQPWTMAAAFAASAAVTQVLAARRVLRATSSRRLFAVVPQRRILRARVAEAVVNQFTITFRNAIWNAPMLLVPWLAGPAAALPLALGQRLPQSFSSAHTALGESFYPAAVQEHAERRARSRVISTSTRFTLLALTPLVVCMAVFAPAVLAVWLGIDSAEAVLALRCYAAVLFAFALSYGAECVVWARHQTARVLYITASVTCAGVAGALIAPAPDRIAVVCVVIALASLMGGAVLFRSAFSDFTEAWEALRHACSGSMVPFAVLGCAALLVWRFREANAWLTVAWAAFIIAIYFVTAFFFALTVAERQLVMRAPVLRTLRSAAFRLPGVRSASALAVHAIAATRSSSAEVARHYDRVFEWDDPFGYSADEYPQVMESIVAQHAPLGRVLEIGCGDGFLVRLLAEHAASVLAVDVSERALVRARGRCSGLANVEIRAWDLHGADELSGFDTIVLAGVLERCGKPAQLRRAQVRVLRMLNPGGKLVISCSIQSQTLEHAWWDRYLLHGSRSITELFSRSAGAEVMECFCTPHHRFLVLKKIPVSPAVERTAAAALA
jgi:O-antigen/teichoic acid export membrane protein/2-polyprenyl-3-methyl-5-hydroxy-6-metoxy-1,4-benzoquinol methylase